MRTVQLLCSAAGEWSALRQDWSHDAASSAQLVLAFGDGRKLKDACTIARLRERFPVAQIVVCSGNPIANDHRTDAGIVATAVQFEHSGVKGVSAALPNAEDSEAVGRSLASKLERDQLRHVLVFAEGLHVNGSALARGIAAALPVGVTVTGGLAGDGESFEQTLVGLNSPATAHQVVLVGLYGARLEIGLGSFGGWEPFGPDRTITRSDGNVLHELDGRRALDLYKELLGPLGYALPASGLLFPLKIGQDAGSMGVIRTILGVDEAAGSLTYAGDVPTGWNAKLMRTNLDALIVASRTAAQQTTSGVAPGRARLALAVSCIGRKLLLQRRVDEELAAVHDVVSTGATLTGFYSYGELAPAGALERCELHNQTMTLTTFGEA